MDEKLKEILKRVFELDTVDESCSQHNCDKWDSLKHLSLVIELESDFDVELEPEEIAKMKNFQDIKEILNYKL